MQKRLLHIVTLLLWIIMSVHAQKYEYWLDGDYNHRTVSAYNGGDISANLDVSDLKPGLHFYNIRIQYDNGLWGPVNRYLFMMPEGTTILPMAIEYWIDDKSPVIRPASGSTITLTSDVSMLEPGNHLFSCRVLATNGTWSDIHSREFTIDILPVEISGAIIEYYIDSDPGYGKGTLVTAIENSDNEFDVDLTDTKPGAHVLYVRTYDGQGHWSSTASHPLYVRNPVSIAEVEYFVDADPGKGKGVSVSLPEKLSEPFDLMIPTDGLLYGEHLFGIRAKGSDGIWTYESVKSFTLDKIIGDINNDGRVNAADIVELVKYIISNPSGNDTSADVNGDGAVNNADIEQIVNIIMGQ